MSAMTRFQLAILLIGFKLELFRLKAVVFVNNIRIAIGAWRIRRWQRKIDRLKKIVDEEK